MPGDDCDTLGGQNGPPRICRTSCLFRRKTEKKGGGGEGRNTPDMIQYDYSAAQLAFIGRTGKLIFGSTKLRKPIILNNLFPILGSVFAVKMRRLLKRLKYTFKSSCFCMLRTELCIFGGFYFAHAVNKWTFHAWGEISRCRGVGVGDLKQTVVPTLIKKPVTQRTGAFTGVILDLQDPTC